MLLNADDRVVSSLAVDMLTLHLWQEKNLFVSSFRYQQKSTKKSEQACCALEIRRALSLSLLDSAWLYVYAEE